MDGGAHHFHQHRAIADEVSLPEGRGIWQGMASFLPPFSGAGMPIFSWLIMFFKSSTIQSTFFLEMPNAIWFRS
jgi:hypothetical protein